MLRITSLLRQESTDPWISHIEANNAHTVSISCANVYNQNE